MIFVLKWFTSDSKARVIARMSIYISLSLALQYGLFLFNLTASTSPQPFPFLIEHYPHLYNNEDFKNIPYGIPFFYKYSMFRDLNISYFLGVGVSINQIKNLVLDFIILVMSSMYMVNFRNPLFFPRMRKVFWTFPSEYDSSDKWKRLDPKVLKQHKWLQSLYSINHEKYTSIRKIVTPEQ